MLFQPTKDEVREFFVSVWEKTQAQTPLSPLESMARDWVLAHPEYHALLSDRDQALAQDWSVTRGQTNPFLHLSMHLALEEQASIDQPQGVRQALAQDWSVTRGQTNPFLHLSMHLALEEQASIDQPQGVRQALARLSQSLDDRHEAMHQAMECLGAMLHEAQASGAPPDGQAYIDCLLRRAGHRGE